VNHPVFRAVDRRFAHPGSRRRLTEGDERTK
jgi:hypothetical protein